MAMTEAALSSQDKEFAFGESEFRFLAKLVGEQTGIVLADHKRDMVYSRLARRLRALELKDFSEYCDLMKSDQGQEELGNLVNAITTNLTSFFREAHHFEHLGTQVLAPLTKNTDRKLRIWSAGCSSGMEPYSIAMTVRGHIPEVAKWDARILATDIDTNMLATGARGNYPATEYEHIPETLRKGVECGGERMQMPEDLQRLIAFKHLNLLQDWPMKGQFDAVFCRNVVIYFDKATQRTLFSRIADRIKPGGWLYIGHSENLTHVSDRFELRGRTIYRRVK